MPDGARVTGDWSQIEHFEALQADLMNMMVWQNYLIGSALGLKQQHFKRPPKPIKRPLEKEKPRRFSTKQDFESMLSGMRKNGHPAK